MFKFFRQIRYNLMGSGKTGRYFKYAIGEILLVVLGILIALSINNWNENRKNRLEEHDILINLKDEFVFNKDALNWSKDIHIIIKEACLELLNYTGPTPTEFDEHKINELLGFTTVSPIFNYRSGSLNSLINSGKISLITNQELRNQISQFPAFISDGTFTETTLREISWNNYLPFLEKNAVIIEAYNASKFFTELLPQKSEFKVDHRSLLSNRQFENMLISRFSITEVVLREYDQLEIRLDDIIKKIELELKK